MSTPPAVPTAAAFGLASCHTCGLLCRPAGGGALSTCPRCGTPLHLRRPASVQRAWAFTLSAAILYVPANVLPVMSSGSLFGDQSDTILSGVVFLWRDGSWALALLVFFASVVVPLAKLGTLVFLLLGVQAGSTWRPLLRARLYRAIEFVGRWSMLDVYVVTLLVGLVRWRSLAVIHAEPGAVAFGAVVVLTMLASQSFDPRLIWDRAGAEGPR
jgi:paraquat-inducible protein A